MNLTINRPLSVVFLQIPTRPLEKLNNEELANLAANNEDARNLLVLKNIDKIRLAAKYVVIQYNLNESPDELESVAIIKLLMPKTWGKGIEDVPKYIFRVSKNAMIDEVRKDKNQKRFTNQFNDTSSMNKAKTLDEAVTDPYTEDKHNSTLDLEDIIYQFAKAIPSLNFRQGKTVAQKIIELSYGIDLGTNPTREELKGEEIAKRFDINLSTIKSLKYRFDQTAKNQLKEFVSNAA